jgi:hypothetical protein
MWLIPSTIYFQKLPKISVYIKQGVEEATLFLNKTFPGNFPGIEELYVKVTWRKNMINALK